MKKKKTENMVQTAVRFPGALAKRIDTLARGMSQDGLRITRSDVLRAALFRGVDSLETELVEKK